jgi:hypothetical protein
MSIVLMGSTSGSCTLQEQAVAGTTVLTLPAVSGTVLTNKSAGTVLQVVSATKTDTQTITAFPPTFVDITGLSVTLTPLSSSSKFLCIWTISAGNGADASTCHFRLNRNGTAIGLADAASNRTTGSSIYANTASTGQMIASSNSYLDSPATGSAVTYNLTASSNNTAPSYINRSARDNDTAAFDGRVTSSITVMEIAG